MSGVSSESSTCHLKPTDFHAESVGGGSCKVFDKLASNFTKMFTVASFQGPAQLFVTYSMEKHSSCNQKQRRPGNETVFTVLLLGMDSKGRQTLDLNSLVLVRNVTLVLNLFLCGVPYHVCVWVCGCVGVWVCGCGWVCGCVGVWVWVYILCVDVCCVCEHCMRACCVCGCV